MRYPEEADRLWRELVPRSGPAETEQGELIRIAGRLGDEALRNGNINWSETHEKLAEHLRKMLVEDDCFDAAAKEEINGDIDRALQFEYPPESSELYDRLLDRVVEFTKAHPEPIPHEHDPDLTF